MSYEGPCFDEAVPVTYICSTTPVPGCDTYVFVDKHGIEQVIYCNYNPSKKPVFRMVLKVFIAVFAMSVCLGICLASLIVLFIASSLLAVTLIAYFVSCKRKYIPNAVLVSKWEDTING